MSQPPTYQQSVKSLTRVRLWGQAVARLTTAREDSRIITDDYMRNLWRYAQRELKRFATLEAKVLGEWCAYAKSCYGDRTPADLILRPCVRKTIPQRTSCGRPKDRSKPGNPCLIYLVR